MVQYMARVIVFFFAFIALASVEVATFGWPDFDEIVDYINKNYPNSTWDAHTYFVDNVGENATIDDLKNLVVTTPIPLESRPPARKHDINFYPEDYDPRWTYTSCSMREIQDQGNCASGWAFATVSAISNRICMASDVNVRISAEDLLSCCPQPKCSNGCGGTHNATEAWNYYHNVGLVTGGKYNSNEGCRPYSIPPFYKDNWRHPTPNCVRKCEKHSGMSYENDKHYGKRPYSVLSDEYHIKREIAYNGPIVATMNVYEDFYVYDRGVYQHLIGKFVGVHSVKMIGWDTDKNGTPYWIIANSWGTNFGERGFMNILRGKNECGIESNLVAAQPDLYRRRTSTGRKL